MSHVAFHSPQGTAYVSGPERALAHWLCPQIALLHVPDHEVLKPLIPNRDLRDRRSFEYWLRLWDNYFVLPDGKRVDTFGVVLNTTLRQGDEILKLMARLDGQCESHAYVEGPNRAWLADLIEKGRNTIYNPHPSIRDEVIKPGPYLRDGMGWEDVVALLRSRDDEPVVTSYSVCDGFPNSLYAGIPNQEEIDDDEWDSMLEESQWKWAMAGLREENNTAQVEMKPENWESFYFSHGYDMMQLVELASQMAVSR